MTTVQSLASHFSIQDQRRTCHVGQLRVAGPSLFPHGISAGVAVCPTLPR